MLQLVIDTESDTPSSSSSLALLPKVPVSFHSSTSVLGAIPPCLCANNKIPALQPCACLYLLLFIPHSMWICIGWIKLDPQWSWLTGWSGWNSVMLLFCSPADLIWPEIPLQPLIISCCHWHKNDRSGMDLSPSLIPVFLSYTFFPLGLCLCWFPYLCRLVWMRFLICRVTRF